MTIVQKIKLDILRNPDALDLIIKSRWGKIITKDNIDEAYQKILVDPEEHYDFEHEFRHGSVNTHIPCEWDRNYESRSVGTQLTDGTWIGWTYWYGGGKHGQPEAEEWMSKAYELEVEEEEKTVIIKTFTKKGNKK
jgi:hypothetical protein